jgi:hypothetical protein
METLPWEWYLSPDVLRGVQERMIERGRLLVDSEQLIDGLPERYRTPSRSGLCNTCSQVLNRRSTET